MGRRNKKSKAKKIVLFSILGVILALILGVVVFAFDVYRDVTGAKEQTDKTVQIEIEPGDSTGIIARKLEDADVIGYSLVFRYMATMQSVDDKLQVGIYEFNAGESYSQILHILKQAPNYRPSVRITFTEGMEVSDIVEKFLEVGKSKGATWTKEGFETALDYDYGYVYIPGVGTENRLEGFLYPDTYDFFLDDTEVNLFAKMISNFNQKAISVDLETKAAAANMTVYEVLTLGSIIQKEGGKISDFAMVSSVFHNRLEIDMLLQSDAAVSYPIPKEERLPSCTYEQLTTDTPYNVYIHKGLTPTPICNPSIDAVVAACEPAESEYYYFIGTPDGQTIFAKNITEHQANVDKYLK